MTTDQGFDIYMTGAEDYQGRIKMALCGYPGAGKTLFSSTAPSPFFIFFRDQPRIMSIADRYMPHTKIFNKYDAEGRITSTVWDTYDEVIKYLRSDRAKDFDTVVIDTGDEFYQAMKEGKTAQNRGKFAIGDWGWIADNYRQRINNAIDLHKHVIVLFHLKQTQEGDEGAVYQELALQGAVKDEAAGWFDIVGVLDQYVATDQKGEKSTKRAILTGATTKYPFVKDHSGKLPKVFDVSDNFVGDFARMAKLVGDYEIKAQRELIEHVEVEKTQLPAAKTGAEIGVPTPADIEAKKEAKRAPQQPAPEAVPPHPVPQAPAASGRDEEGASDGGEPAPEPVVEEPAPEPVSSPEEGSADAGVPEVEVGAAEAGPPDEGVTEEEATARIEEAFGPTTTVEATCQYEVDGKVCARPLVKDKVDANNNKVADANGEIIVVPDTDLIELTQIRFRKHLCREHFTQLRKGA